MKAGCNGACFFRINYNISSVAQAIGENFSAVNTYAYDFGGDSDNELVVIVDQQKIGKCGDYDGSITVLYIYAY